jgi:hypothetical protein
MRVITLCLGLLVCALSSRGDDTKATLKETLTIKDVQGGFAGFTGDQWTVEPSGKWSIATVFNERLTEKAKGMLTREQMTGLVKELEKYQLASLRNKGEEGTNPHVVTIRHGKKEVHLILPTGDALPKPDATSIEGRYAGIAAAVQRLLKAK